MESTGTIGAQTRNREKFPAMTTNSSAQESTVTSTIDHQLPRAMPGRQEPYRFRVDQYERMGDAGILTESDRVELIDGQVMNKMTKNRPHVVAAQLAHDALVRLLPAGWYVGKEDPVRISGVSEPEPDLAVIRGHPRDYLEQSPAPSEVALVVEVAESSLAFDQTDKLRIYASAGIPAYWIVNLIDRRLEVYSDPDSGGYRTRIDLGPSDTASVLIDGKQTGRIVVADLLP
jgi:Uma2 family endonuclease